MSKNRNTGFLLMVLSCFFLYSLSGPVSAQAAGKKRAEPLNYEWDLSEGQTYRYQISEYSVFHEYQIEEESTKTLQMNMSFDFVIRVEDDRPMVNLTVENLSASGTLGDEPFEYADGNFSTGNLPPIGNLDGLSLNFLATTHLIEDGQEGYVFGEVNEALNTESELQEFISLDVTYVFCRLFQCGGRYYQMVDSGDIRRVLQIPAGEIREELPTYYEDGIYEISGLGESSYNFNISGDLNVVGFGTGVEVTDAIQEGEEPAAGGRRGMVEDDSQEEEEQDSNYYEVAFPTGHPLGNLSGSFRFEEGSPSQLSVQSNFEFDSEDFEETAGSARAGEESDTEMNIPKVLWTMERSLTFSRQ